MDETNRERVMTLREAQFNQGDKSPLKKPVPDPVTARKTEVQVSPRKTELAAKQVQDNAQDELLVQDHGLNLATKSDPEENAKASKMWPEQYEEDPERVNVC